MKIRTVILRIKTARRRADMREIEYRGKRPDGKWECGYFMIDPSGAYSFILNVTSHVVDRETVGQYTGLTDTKGIKIFEGDIVLRINVESTGIENRIKSLITFEKGCFMIGQIGPWPWRNPGYSLYDDYQKLTEFDGYLEVIGNIHDTPELLAGNKEE
jgi:uncharacterized phage protein (TIGR01671 family)